MAKIFPFSSEPEEVLFFRAHQKIVYILVSIKMKQFQSLDCDIISAGCMAIFTYSNMISVPYYIIPNLLKFELPYSL
jgi:hypothetical protein